ncbi:MAG: hypothetical protein ACLR13_05265 [Acutalibacteraceae bacterium]
MQDNIFTVKDLSFAYGKQKVLDDLALTLHEGTITTLIEQTAVEIHFV